MIESKNNNMEIIKPIFIVGVPRSGTTLLYRLLAQHPELAWFSKNAILKFYSKEYLHFIFLRRRIFDMRKILYPKGPFTPRFFSVYESPIEMGQLWNWALGKGWETTENKKNLNVLKRFIRELLAEKKKKRFLAKYPRNSIKISVLKKIFPDSKFIHIIRDPRAVVNSMLKRSVEFQSGYFGIPLKEKILPNLSEVEKHALQWKQVTEEIKTASSNLENERFFEIHYEDFVNSTENFLKEITKFCELQPHSYSFEVGEKTEQQYDNEKLNFGIRQKIKVITNRNKQSKNDSQIIRSTYPTCNEFGYD